MKQRNRQRYAPATNAAGRTGRLRKFAGLNRVCIIPVQKNRILLKSEYSEDKNEIDNYILNKSQLIYQIILNVINFYDKLIIVVNLWCGEWHINQRKKNIYV